jgi:DNA-directed RNA polymerase subunit M/transcription elongation factor TFIIS
MASYTHTCEACGVEMTVHDRYYGRTLRCRECRAEFVADPAAPGGPAGAGRTPPSTLHTCTACGTVMTVAERYYGRTLHCVECGEEFVARLPVAPPKTDRPAADTAPPPQSERREVVIEVPQDAGRRSRRLRWALAVSGILVLAAALIWWLGGNREQGLGSSLFTAEKQRTQIGRLRLEDEATVPVALDRDAFDQLLAAVESNDSSSLQAFRASPRCLSLPTGTRVRVLERRKRGAEARVRILEGPESSRIVWVPIRWVK